MDLYLGEVIGVSVMLLIALYAALTVLVEEIKKDIHDYKKRNHWRKRYK